MPKFYTTEIKKRFNSDNLRKIGEIATKATQASKNYKVSPGKYKNIKLQSLATKIGSGQGWGTIKRRLTKIGVNYKKINIIQSVLEGKRKGGLTEYQKEKNRSRSQQRDEFGLTRGISKTNYAGGGVLTKSVGISEIKKEGMGGIGINTGPVGFAGGQTGKATIGINSKS